MHKRQVNKAGIDERSNIKQNIKEMRTCGNTQKTGWEGIQNKQYTQRSETESIQRRHEYKTWVQDMSTRHEYKTWDKNRIKIKVRSELTDNMITKEKDKELTEKQMLEQNDQIKCWNRMN